MASDNFYAILATALIKSIELNHKTKELIDFIIIDDGISKTNKEKIINSVNPEMTTISWVKIKDIVPPGVTIPLEVSHYPITAYLRLFAPAAAGVECKKLIYLDVDMILYDDISLLYHTNIGDNIVGAVQDYQMIVSSPTAIRNYKELGLPANMKYFNSGLLLMNTEKWIQEDIANKVIQCLYDNKKYILYPDQYGLNVVLRNDWYEIGRIWNHSDLFEYPDDVKLVHFIDIKPIFKSCFSKEQHKREFYRILGYTAYKDFKPIPEYRRLFNKGFSKIKNKITKA